MGRPFISTLTSKTMQIINRILRLLVILPFTISAFTLLGGESIQYQYALPRGHPFTKSSFVSQNDPRVLLLFGERLDIVSSWVRDDVVWYRFRKEEGVFFLPEQYVVTCSVSSRYDKNNNLALGREVIDREHAISLFYRPKDLVVLPEKYRADGYENRVLLLREEAGQAFISMMEDAEKVGVCIRVISAFRDARYQSYLYQRAIDRYGPVQGSVAKPGHSEHQLGTTCDLTTDEIGYSLSGGFEATAAFEWLKKNSYRYGISHSYPKHKQRVTGYIYEPWHFRYWGEDRWRNQIDRMGLFFTR
jgi:LAS superfamily LD-carboxypeptidase LdcB